MSNGPHPLDPLRQLVAGDDVGGRWWFHVERRGGAVWDRLCEPMHAVAAWAIDLAAPRPERRRQLVVRRA